MTTDQKHIVTKYVGKLREVGTMLDDFEAAHSKADDILLSALRELGYGEISDAFDEACEAVGFYYA